MTRNQRLLTLLSGGAFSPLSLSPTLWEKADAGTFQTSGGSVAAANDDPVGQYQDQSGNANHAGALTTVRPLLKTNVAGTLPMIQPDASDDVMALTSSIAMTGAFTVYAVGTRANSTNWIPLADTHLTAGLLIFGSDNNVYFLNDAGSWVNTAVSLTGTFIARFRRDASNVCKFAATGVAEVTVGTQSGTMTMSKVMARPTTQFNGGTNKFGELILFNGTDLPTSNATGNTNVLTYLTRWGVTLP